MHGLALAIERNVSAALEEDVGSGDLTAGLIPSDNQAAARIITRSDAVVCGSAWVADSDTACSACSAAPPSRPRR